MGGHKWEPKVASPLQLIHHPNFKYPTVPDFLKTKQDIKVNAVVDYVIESVARFLSPSPKVEDEHEEYSCDDLAEALKRHIGPQIKVQLAIARTKKELSK